MSRSIRLRGQVFAIIRVEPEAPEEHAVTVKRVVRELPTAEAEISRLKSLNGDRATIQALGVVQMRMIRFRVRRRGRPLSHPA